MIEETSETHLRVLQVEDSENDAALIVRTLTKAGYDVESLRVEGVEDFRRALKQKKWDVIISDSGVPQFGTLSALRIVQETHQDIPIIVVSGSITQEAASTILKSGVRDCLQKNSLDRLPSVVERETRAARLRHEAGQIGPSPHEFLAGGREMAKVILDKDWSKTPLGPIANWPPSLRTTVSLCLASNFPISIAWGPHRVQLYNDGYWPICAAKHPESMGQDFKECWSSAWPAIGEAFERAQNGEASYLENQRMFLDRRGFLEEAFFTFSFSPIRDENGRVEGLFNPVIETTPQMLAERRSRTLRDVAARSANAKSVDEACQMTIQVLAESVLDLPFALLYLLDGEKAEPRLAGSFGLPAEVARQWSTVDVGHNDLVIENIANRVAGLECGPYPEAPHQAAVVPLPGLGLHRGVLVAGISSRLPFDEAYRGFFELLSTSIANALASARGYQAKTLFFSNVSHQLRTPLSLMLAPVEDLLLRGAGGEARLKEELSLVLRNGLRLQKMVNNLIDFSRLEAGHMQAVLDPTDLGPLTADLAGAFRPAIERAGLQLVVDCPSVDQPACVDPDMWEKIVLNLISNAFKFTLQGKIQVRLRMNAGRAELAVEDTGIGIPESELPRVFERFHRIPTAAARTHEGMGIGLALVQELARLHGGAVSVVSELGSGSTFTVSIPCGQDISPQSGRTARRSSTATGSAIYVDEALRWLPDEPRAAQSELAVDIPLESRAAVPGSVLLLADDNADMRQYLQRILSERYEVHAVADGQAALEFVRQSSAVDLVLTDVRMPRMGGFELLRNLRSDPRTKAIPVILLSASAGEESRIEGFDAGADAYLLKPFTVRELLARVDGHLRLSKARKETANLQESELRFRTMANSAPVMIWTCGVDGRPDYFNTRWNEFIGDSKPSDWIESLHPDDCARCVATFAAAISDRNCFDMECRLRRHDGQYRWVLCSGGPRRLPGGELLGHTVFCVDIQDRKTAEQTLQDTREDLHLAQLVARVGTFHWDIQNNCNVWSPELEVLHGLEPGSFAGTYEAWSGCVHPDDLPAAQRAILSALETGRECLAEWRVIWPDGTVRWLESRGWVFKDDAGKPLRMVGVNVDITERKEAERRILQLNADLEKRVIERTAQLDVANKELEAFAYSVSHDLRAPLRGIDGWSEALEEDYVELLDARGKEYLRLVRSETRRMSVLIDDLLQFSRFARAEMERSIVDLSSIAETVVSRLLEAHASRKIRFAIQPGLKANVDGRLLEVVLTNLFSNAVKFTGSRPEALIEFGQTDTADGPAYYVRDNGVGFDMAYAATLFGAFQRLHKPSEFPGSGVGLATVQRIIHRHSGRVWADAQTNQGATFYFTVGE